jgi:hypothetical protein
MRALKELCSRALYKAGNITINKEWTDVLQQDSKKCIENTNFDCESDMEIESDSERPSETLVHGFIDSQCIHDLQDKIIEVTPAEGQCPLGIFMDKYVEEMNFPTLFYGNPCDDDIVKRFSYQKIVKWELLHASNDFSYHTTNLFFKMCANNNRQSDFLCVDMNKKGTITRKKVTGKRCEVQTKFGKDT